MVHLHVGTVSSPKRRRAAGSGRRLSHARVHGDRSSGHRLRGRSSRIESRSREVHQRRIRLDFNRYIAICLSYWAISSFSRFLVHTDAGFADYKACNNNVYNPDDSMCFVWAVLSALHPADKHTERITKCRSYLNSIDLTGLKFPVSVNQIARFEKNNPTISINVYILGKDGREIIPKFVTKCGAREKHIDLLRRKLAKIVITRGSKI
jgi:hypothetical protein